jgi:hypothetical protein
VNHDLICAWLGLSEAVWPPTHYQLLDLNAGESDVELIEQRVQQRLDALRCYQCTHPEQATEAMNRLAQAMLCLTDPEAKRAYDLELGLVPPAVHPVVESRLPPRPPVLPPPLPPLPASETAEQSALVAVETAPLLLTSRDPLAWMYARAGSLSLHSTPPPLPSLPPPEFARPEKLKPAPAAAPPAPSAERVDPVVEAVRSPEARTGLGTLGGILRRVRLTRQLLLAWERLGEFLVDPRRKLKLPEEEEELATAFRTLSRLLRRFPPLLGSAGQPGHLIGSLAAQDIVPTFRYLQRGQRVALARDWQAGHKLLTLYRAFLLDEFRLVRTLCSSRRFRRAVHTFVTDQRPAVGLLILGLVALNVFFWTWLIWLTWSHG